MGQVHHYLFNQQSGVVNYRRVDHRTIRFSLPGARAVSGVALINDFLQPVTYGLTLARQAKKALVVFDGDLLPDGLPRASKRLKSFPETLCGIDLPVHRMRKYDLESPPFGDFDSLGDGGLRRASMVLHRHFVLLPIGTAVVRCWRPVTFSCVYRMIVVEPKRGGGMKVTWLNTDA